MIIRSGRLVVTRDLLGESWRDGGVWTRRKGLASEEGPSPDAIIEACGEEIVLRRGDGMRLDDKEESGWTFSEKKKKHPRAKRNLRG